MAWIAAGAAIVGGMMSSDAAGDASAAQQQSGREANALQKAMYDQTRTDNAPFMARGNAAGVKLADLLGLDVPASSIAQFGGTGGGPTAEQLRAQLLEQYSSGATGGWSLGGNEGNDSIWTPSTRTVDEAGLQAAINQRLAQQQAQTDQQAPAARSANFGSLLKPFTGADLATEPGYQFGLNQGQTAIDRSAASRGGLYSGATLKALARFGSDYGGTKYNEAFNRDQVSKNQQFGMLSGVAGTGQTATSQVSSATQNYGTQAGNTITDMGNARASGYVGGANAWTNAIGSGVNNYQQSSLLKQLAGNGRSGYGAGTSGWYNDASDIPMQAGGGY